MTATTKKKTAAKTMATDFPPAVSRDADMIETLRADPAYAEIYLQTALEDIYQEGGIPAFLIALRRVIDASGGVGEIAKKSGITRQHIYRALAEGGNPTLTTLTEITRAAGVRLTSTH